MDDSNHVEGEDPVIMPKFLMVAVCVGMTAIGSLSLAEEKEIIFHDDFNREDADAVGNEWSTRGSAVVKDNAALFKAKEEEFRPRMKRTFPVQQEGKFTASFKMDWLRESEGTWSFHMQLGNSAEIPRLLIYDADLAKGIGVNLVWGGGELVNFQPAGSFGYSKNGEFKPLFVVNDAKNKQTVVDHRLVTIAVDVDSGTYSVKFNGKTYADLPFDNKVSIDTIRFIANGCSASGFSQSSIDEVMITKGE